MNKQASTEKKNNRFCHCALVTGASSGIGREIARILVKKGCFVVLSGRNEKALEALRNELGRDKADIIAADLSDTKSCIDLYAKVKKYDIDILINNAGFGIYGDFLSTSLSKELEMIDVNIKAMHIMFKLFLKDFVKKDRGYILNVGSVAGLMAGPLMSSYYSTKNYVVRQTQAVYEELRRRKSKVSVSVLCPGPVSTEFNRRAGIEGFMKGITAKECAHCAVDGLFAGKLMIIPSLKIQLAAVAAKFAPIKLMTFVLYILQSGKKSLD
ncbi:MAG: SDR family NAD(P)-dependent oxidoreductase [Oscillospiraceae bacterium]